MRAVLCSLFLVIAACFYSLSVQSGQQGFRGNAMNAPQNVDKADVNAVYSIDWLRHISAKYHLFASDSIPVHLRKMNSPFRELAVLVRDQGITEQEMVTYKMFKRFPLIQGLKMDSLGRVLCELFFLPTSPSADSAVINMLRGYGSQLLTVMGPVAGGTLVVRGFFPICHLEEITKHKEVRRVDKVLPSIHQQMGRYDTEGDHVIHADVARQRFFLDPQYNNPNLQPPSIALMSDGMQHYTSSQSTGDLPSSAYLAFDNGLGTGDEVALQLLSCRSSLHRHSV